jgi:hypothetical protein
LFDDVFSDLKKILIRYEHSGHQHPHKMPKVTVCEIQADLLEFPELLLLSAGLLDETEDSYCEDLSQLADEEELLEDVGDEQFELQISEVLELAGVAWLEAASASANSGSPACVCKSAVQSIIVSYSAIDTIVKVYSK